MVPKRLFQTEASAAVILVRLIVGLVFLSEGIQKFLFPDSLGPGRFLKIGLPAPEFLAYFVAVFEITCGTLIVLGLLTRLAVTPPSRSCSSPSGPRRSQYSMTAASGNWRTR